MCHGDGGFYAFVCMWRLTWGGCRWEWDGHDTPPMGVSPTSPMVGAPRSAVGQPGRCDRTHD